MTSYGSSQILTEDEVLRALDYYAAAATAEARLKGLIPNAPGGEPSGYALCLHHAAIESETGLPSVMLPHGGGIPKRLQSSTCPPKFSSFFARWAMVVSNIQQLSQRHKNDLEQTICKLPVGSPAYDHYVPPHFYPLQHPTALEVHRISDYLLSLANDMHSCRELRPKPRRQVHSLPSVTTNFPNSPRFAPQFSTQTVRYDGTSPTLQPPMSLVQPSPFFNYPQSASPLPLRFDSLPSSASNSSHSPISDRFSPGSASGQGTFVGGFVAEPAPPPGLSSYYMTFPSPEPYEIPSLSDTNSPTPRGINATMQRQTLGSNKSSVSTETIGTIIGAYTPTSEIITELCSHGCRNLTDMLDRSTVSLRPVSQGGFGEVYFGRLLDGTSVALKIIVVHQDDESKQHKHAARELHTWSKCKHPNIAALLGLVEFNDRIAMVSRWMENGDLRKYVKNNPGVDRFNLCIQIARGLEYLHSTGIIHGDLKGPNVLISSDGTPALIDFGNATMSNSTVQFTQTATKQNFTPRWTAPELLHNAKPGPASDIYALGMTILEAFTGEAPYSGLRDSAVMFTVGQLMKLPDRPTKHIPENQLWGDMLWQLLVGCWWSTPEERPTAADVCQHLQKIAYECQRG